MGQAWNKYNTSEQSHFLSDTRIHRRQQRCKIFPKKAADRLHSYINGEERLPSFGRLGDFASQKYCVFIITINRNTNVHTYMHGLAILRNHRKVGKTTEAADSK